MAGLSLCLGDTDDMIDLQTGSGHSVESNWQLSAREDSILYIDNAASVSRTQMSI